MAEKADKADKGVMDILTTLLGKLSGEAIEGVFIGVVYALVTWLWGFRREDSGKKDAPLVDIRVPVLNALTPHDQFPNMWRRIREAKERKEDNALVALLAKVPDVLKKHIYEALEKMSDPEFDDAMALLHHDVIWQFMERVVAHASPPLKKAWDICKKVKTDFGEWHRTQAARASARRQARREDIRLHGRRQPTLPNAIRWKASYGLLIIPVLLCLLGIIINVIKHLWG